MGLEVSVIVCTYTERRWDLLKDAISSLRAQTIRPREIIVVVDHAPALLERVARELDTIAVPNTGPRGEAGSRNSGIRAATGDVVAFIDDDAIAEPEWLERLSEPYADDEIAAVGGAILPRWSRPRPFWFPSEFNWIVGCTYRGMPEVRADVRNLIGANMSFRRGVFERLEFFAGLGHAGGRSLGGTETDFCIRLSEVRPGARIVYEPGARVHHHVPPERARFSYFLSRCFNEGLSKGVLARRVGSRIGLASERAYVLGVLPQIARKRVTDALIQRRPSLAVPIVASVAGLAAATAGYAVSRVRRLSARSQTGEA